MAPKYKLTYFNARGKAEIIRYIFAQAGVDYEDIRIEKEKWPEYKPKMPFGKVPVLEFDGTVLPESGAICGYLAREHGLSGKNNLEAAKCDMIYGAFGDLLTQLVPWRLETDPAKKEEIRKKFVDETLPPALTKFNAALEKNNGGKAFLIGDQITWGDLTAAYVLEFMNNFAPAALTKFPLLKAYMERILSQPKIKAWIAKRPVTEN